MEEDLPLEKSIAFFDFDGTLTHKDTLAELIRFIKGKRKYFWGLCMLSPAIISYKLGIIKNDVAKQLLLVYFLKGFKIEEFNALCNEFAETKLPQLLKKSALQEIRKHLQNKTQVVVISASAENWISPWCKKYEIECIATKLEVKNGKLTGKIDGKNCSGTEKVKLIKNKFDLSAFKHIYAYGDSRKDIPMLNLATEKFYKPFRSPHS